MLFADTCKEHNVWSIVGIIFVLPNLNRDTYRYLTMNAQPVFPLGKIDAKLWPGILEFAGRESAGALLDLNLYWRQHAGWAVEVAGAQWWGSRQMARMICRHNPAALRNVDPRTLWYIVRQLARLGKTAWIDRAVGPILRSRGYDMTDVNMHQDVWIGRDREFSIVAYRNIEVRYLNLMCHGPFDRQVHMATLILDSHPEVMHDKNPMSVFNHIHHMLGSTYLQSHAGIEMYRHIVGDALELLKRYGRPCKLSSDHVFAFTRCDAEVAASLSKYIAHLGDDNEPNMYAIAGYVGDSVHIVLSILEAHQVWPVWCCAIRLYLR